VMISLPATGATTVLLGQLGCITHGRLMLFYFFILDLSFIFKIIGTTNL
jgi:hypothetical protein